MTAFNVRVGSATDVGRLRKINQDSIVTDGGIYGVADGMGGHQGGEVASAVAVEVLSRGMQTPTPGGFEAAVKAANLAVYEQGQARDDLAGMGTTVVAVAEVDVDDEPHLVIVNVGDSRGYLLRDRNLVQVTEDHSLVADLVRAGRITPEEAENHPRRNIVTRVLGLDDNVRVDQFAVLPFEGDRFLMCSDGLTNEVSEPEITATLRRIDDPEAAAVELVRMANESGGRDNISVVIVDVLDDAGQSARASAAIAADPSGLESRGDLDDDADLDDESAVEPGDDADPAEVDDESDALGALGALGAVGVAGAMKTSDAAAVVGEPTIPAIDGGFDDRAPSSEPDPDPPRDPTIVADEPDPTDAAEDETADAAADPDPSDQDKDDDAEPAESDADETAGSAEHIDNDPDAPGDDDKTDDELAEPPDEKLSRREQKKQRKAEAAAVAAAGAAAVGSDTAGGAAAATESVKPSILAKRATDVDPDGLDGLGGLGGLDDETASTADDDAEADEREADDLAGFGRALDDSQLAEADELVDVEDTDSDLDELAPTRRAFSWRVAVFLFVLFAVVGIAVGALGVYARGTYYVGFDDNRVAVFQGRPGGVLFFDPTVEAHSNVSRFELLPVSENQVDNDPEFGSFGEAEVFVTNLQLVTLDKAPVIGEPGSFTDSTSPSTTSTVVDEPSGEAPPDEAPLPSEAPAPAGTPDTTAPG